MNKATKTITKMRVLWAKVPAQKQLLFMGLACIAALVTFTARFWLQRAQESINDSVEQFGMGFAQALARGGAEALTNSGDLKSLKYYILTQREFYLPGPAFEFHLFIIGAPAQFQQLCLSPDHIGRTMQDMGRGDTSA